MSLADSDDALFGIVERWVRVRRHDFDCAAVDTAALCERIAARNDRRVNRATGAIRL